jgi:hypothetical protein
MLIDCYLPKTYLSRLTIGKFNQSTSRLTIVVLLVANYPAGIDRVNEAKLRSPDCKLGGRSEWSEPLIVRAHECARKGKTVFQISAF